MPAVTTQLDYLAENMRLRMNKIYKQYSYLVVLIALITGLLIGVPGISTAGVGVNSSDNVLPAAFQDPEEEEEDEEEEVVEEEPGFLDRIMFWREPREEEEDPYLDMSVDELNAELFHAIREDDPEVVLDVLQYGASINARNNHRRTPLIEASRLGRTEIAELLIANRASINARDMYSGSALRYASRGGYSEIVYLLLENGAIPE